MQTQGKENAFSRLYAVTGCRTQIQLAELFEIRQSSISDVKKRNAIPAEWLVNLLRLKGINPEWILTGLGPQKLGPAKGEPATHVIYLTETKPPKECSAQDLVNELVRRALSKL